MLMSDTIAAVATGMNNSGIGIIRISGKDSFNVASSIFYSKSGHNKKEFDSHRVYYGYIKDGEKIIDEVLLITLKAPKSFTGEDTVEIDCHGGNLVMRRILETVLKNGARAAEPGEFTKRAFINGRIDLSEAEAVIDVINSENDYALSNSIKQLEGDLYKKIIKIRDRIKYDIAYIEAAIDDPEHYNLDGYYEKLTKTVESIKAELTLLKNSFKDGKIISEGINTVIIGKPNVGKSSLLNLLTGEDTAIVTDIAGTTRDVIKQSIIIGNINLNVYDTAGIRDTDDVIEKIGVKLAKKYADDADLILMLIDSSLPLDEDDLELFEYVKDRNTIILLNKSDLESRVSIDEVKKYSDKSIMQISALDKTGIQEFKDKIEEMFLNDLVNYNDEVIITNLRHLNLIESSLLSLDEVSKSIENEMPEDFISIDMINAYESLGYIIGEKTEDDIIDEIFSKFCMGK